MRMAVDPGAGTALVEGEVVGVADERFTGLVAQDAVE